MANDNRPPKDGQPKGDGQPKRDGQQPEAGPMAYRLVEIGPPAVLKAAAESLPLQELGWQPALAFPADAELGPNLAMLQKLELAA